MKTPHIDFGFIVLHYMAEEMTEKCVDDLLKKFSSNNIIIVVVDNASPNGSGRIIEAKYINNPLVKVILHTKNDGFARGNNIGFTYLKGKYDVEFMIIMNNDVFIKSDNFLEQITTIFSEYKFDVLGPDVYATKIKCHQNPQSYTIPDLPKIEWLIKEYKKQIRKDNIQYYKLKILHYLVFWWAKIILKHVIPRKYQQIQSKKFAENKDIVGSEYFDKNVVFNAVLQGACLIFSKKFINKQEYAFFPETFLYFEEQILALQCVNKKYKIMYHPSISVDHLCSVSTEVVFGNGHKKSQLFWKECIKSLKIYKKLYLEYDSLHLQSL